MVCTFVLFLHLFNYSPYNIFKTMPINKKVRAKSSNGMPSISSPTEKINEHPNLDQTLYHFSRVTLSPEVTTNSTTTSFQDLVPGNFSLQQCPVIFLSELHEYLSNSTINTQLPSPAPSTIKRNKLKTPRPKNSFMTYRMEIQYKILTKFPGMNNKEISRLAGIMWMNASEKFKDIYRHKALLLKAQHKRQYPEYKFSPRKRSVKTKRKKEARSSMAVAALTERASSPEDTIKDDIISTGTNDNCDDCNLSVSDSDTVSIKEEIMNVDSYWHGTANLNSDWFYTPPQYIPYTDYAYLTHEEPIETKSNFSFSTRENSAITPSFSSETAWFEYGKGNY